MDPDPAIIISLEILAVITAFLASLSYWSVAGINEGKMNRLAEAGDEKARRVMALTDRLYVLWERLFCLQLVCFAVLSGGLTFLAKYLPLDRVWGVALLWALGTVIFALLGVLLPKSIGLHYGDTLSTRLLGVISCLKAVALPFALLPMGLRYLLLLPFGIHKGIPADQVTEEEILMMLDEGEESGAIRNNERDMIEGIFELDDTTAGEIMTHRTDISAIDKNEPLTEAQVQICQEGYSRIPVFDEDIDDIVGVLFAKDLLRYVGDPAYDTMCAKEVMRQILYVPEAMKCRDLIAILRENKAQIAVVVDEYGGTSGLVTMEDILETIVGNIQDEYDDEEAEVTRHDEHTLSIDGTLPLDDVEKLLDIHLPEQSDYDTLSGLLMDLLGRIPGEDEYPKVDVQGWTLQVQSVEDRRITRVLAKKKEEKHSEEE